MHPALVCVWSRFSEEEEEQERGRGGGIGGKEEVDKEKDVREKNSSKILELLKSWLLAQEVDNEVDDLNVSGQWSRKI